MSSSEKLSVPIASGELYRCLYRLRTVCQPRLISPPERNVVVYARQDAPIKPSMSPRFQAACCVSIRARMDETAWAVCYLEAGPETEAASNVDKSTEAIRG